jgi:uncharacterized protein (TIGR02246 family)
MVTAAEQHVLDLEKRYWQAMKDKDVDTAVSLTDDPCIVTGAQGVASVGRDTFAGLMRKAKWTLHRFDFDDAQVRLLSDDIAIVAYKVREELTVDGQALTLEAADSSTWVRRDGRWVCALHTEAPAGDPFRRDRQGADPVRTER